MTDPDSSTSPPEEPPEDLPDELPEDLLPDTAMASGSDEGEPGERGDAGPLDAGERRLLEELERGVDGPSGGARPDPDA